MLTWKRRDLCFVSGSNCLVTRYPGRPILTTHKCKQNEKHLKSFFFSFFFKEMLNVQERDHAVTILTSSDEARALIINKNRYFPVCKGFPLAVPLKHILSQIL